MYLLLLIYYCLLSDWAGFVGSYDTPSELTYLKYWLYRFSISILLLMEELTFCVGFPFLRFTLVLTIKFLLKDIAYMLCRFYVVYIEHVHM